MLLKGVLIVALTFMSEEAFGQKQNREDDAIEQMYAKADYAKIADRYESADRVKKLSPWGQKLLIQVLSVQRPESVLKVMWEVLPDQDLGEVALAAILHSSQPVGISKSLRARLTRTDAGQIALLVNERRLPVAVAASQNLQRARMSVLNAYFFGPIDPERRFNELKKLTELTAQYFRDEKFTSGNPAPPALIEAATDEQLALKLAVLPYLKHPASFLKWSDLISVPANAGVGK